MNRARRIGLTLLGAVGIALAIWLALSPREPRFAGRKLSAWVRQLALAPDVASPEWQEAARAIRGLGSNALPALLEMATATDPQWKIRIVDQARDAFDLNLNHWLVAPERQRALLGFRVLRAQAYPAIPQLAAMITNANPDMADVAFLALAEIGTPEVLPPLLGALHHTNTILQAAAALSLGTLRSRAHEAVPALAAAADSRDPLLRVTAVRSLGMIGRGPEFAVPALVRVLAETNSQLTSLAAESLTAFGSEAQAALPALRALRLDREEFSRRRLARAIVRVQCDLREGGIFRGPKTEKRIALVFTGHEFAEGGDTILHELERHRSRASFFLTGDFLRNPEFSLLVSNLVGRGHYLGPHSDKHLLYCAWDNPQQTLVTEEEFAADFQANLQLIPGQSWSPRRFSRYFLPPFEHYNRDIVDWTRKQRWTLINFTPGTRANADYTGEADKNFVSSQAIFDSILQRERDDPHGLNGFILLLHLGSGPGRTDKFHARFGELLDTLAAKGYQFVRLDELLDARPPTQFEGRTYVE